MIKKLSIYPPALAWNFVSFGLMIFLCCSGWSVARAKVYQLQVAEYKLAVGSALSEVKKVSDTLEKSAETSAIALKEKRKISKLTQQSNATIEQVEQSIDQDIAEILHGKPKENH